MIRQRHPQCTIADWVFCDAWDVITKSGAAHTIEDAYRQSTHGGGRPSSGLSYTVSAVLVALLVRFLMGRPYSIRGAMDTIGEFTEDQLASVGMAGQNRAPIWTDTQKAYKQFHRFWTSRMRALDPDFDFPATRMTNAEFDARLTARSDADRIQSELASERLTAVCNDLLYGSIKIASPPNCEGDVMVDETTINTALPDGVLGTRPTKWRGASSVAGYWAREKRSGVIKDPSTSGSTKAGGFGVGATFLSRIARRDALHAEPALFIGMDIHVPRGASVAGLETALAHARRTGIDCRRTGRHRWPFLVADMGYNAKKGFGRLMVKTQYSPVVRYPQHWGVQFASSNPPGFPDDVLPGPIQYAGSFICPAGIKRISGHRTPRSTDLLERDEFRAHDRRLQSAYPYLMGYHSRPAMADVLRGRPRLGREVPKLAKIRLVCPASLGTVMCPLKPESMHTDSVGLPLAEPEWTAETFACCSNASVTVYLTDDQLRMAQWDLVPGSWEHTLYYEAVRALTEQRFSQLKSDHVAGLDELTTGPRRTPMIKLAIALAAAAVNIGAQKHHDPKTRRTESIDIKVRQLTRDLGRPPTSIPPRS